MWGPPEDVPGECNAQLHIADDYGDNHATMRCSLPPGHEGPHKEVYQHKGEVVVTWHGDDREDESDAEEDDDVESEDSADA